MDRDTFVHAGRNDRVGSTDKQTRRAVRVDQGGRTGRVDLLADISANVLMVMRASWGGFYFAEPRWRVPFAFAVVGTLLQIGLWLMDRKMFFAVANAIFAAALIFGLATLTSILHPDSPILQSNSPAIKILFLLLFSVSLCGGIALTAFIRLWLAARMKRKTP